jgi:hypothetical protein
MNKIKGYAGGKWKEEIRIGKADFCNQLRMKPTIFIKGFTVGVVICAPVGPIGLLCVRRTLGTRPDDRPALHAGGIHG